MIDFLALMTQAEQELTDSDTLLRTTKAGILYGVLAQSLQQYARVPITASEVLALMTVLVKDGRLFDSLPRSEGLRLLSRPPDKRQSSVPVSPDPDLPPPPGPAFSPSPEDVAAREEDVRIMTAKGYRPEEIAAILALKESVTAGAEVLYRSDADLAQYEAESQNPFPGLPKGQPLNGFTAQVSDPLPPDLKSS